MQIEKTVFVVLKRYKIRDTLQVDVDTYTSHLKPILKL